MRKTGGKRIRFKDYVAKTLKEMEKSFQEGEVSNYYYHDLWDPAVVSGNYHCNYHYY